MNPSSSEHPLNPTLKRMLSLCGLERSFVRGEGVWLFDAEGRRFLDFYAQYGVLALGHNAPCVVEAARKALLASEPAMVQPYRARNAEALAALLVQNAPPGLTCCFLTNTGAETVEAAIKLVRSRTGRSVILTAEGSFHGKTMGALAATGQRQYADGFGPAPPGFERVPFGDADRLRERLERGSKDVAAFLVEPIQGERGVHIPPSGYLTRARELCTRHGVALILDEIQTGLGRTGRLFACDHEGISPDVLLLSKALGGGLFPLGACLVATSFWDDRFALLHSSTFANNNIACGVGLAMFDELRRGPYGEEVARKGALLLSGLERIAARYPRVVLAVRGRGLMCALELAPLPADGGLFLSYLYYQGLYAYTVASMIAERASVLVLPTLGDGNVLRLTPPLVITEDEISMAVEGIDSVCATLDRCASDEVARAIGALAPRPRLTLARAAAEPHISFQTPKLCLPSSSSYAFLIHYTQDGDVKLTDPPLARLSADELQNYLSYASRLPFGVVVRPAPVRSATGAVAEGLIMALPEVPRDMLRQGRNRICEEIARAVDLAGAFGARIVGLGGFTVPYSERGAAIVGRGPAITTGNVLTAGMAFAAARRVAERRGLRVADADVAVIGARGSVGTLCTRLFARERPRRLILIGNPASGVEHLLRLCDEIGREPGAIEVTTDLERVGACDLVLTATSAARPVLDGAPLRSGTIICDVARPYDTSPRIRARSDLTVLDGGLVALPDPTLRFGVGNLQGLPDGVQLACFAETVLLALEGEYRDHGIGDDVPVEQVDWIMAIASKHGFRLADPPLDALDL